MHPAEPLPWLRAALCFQPNADLQLLCCITNTHTPRSPARLQFGGDPAQRRPTHGPWPTCTAAAVRQSVEMGDLFHRAPQHGKFSLLPPGLQLKQGRSYCQPAVRVNALHATANCLLSAAWHICLQLRQQQQPSAVRRQQQPACTAPHTPPLRCTDSQATACGCPGRSPQLGQA